MGGCQNYGPFLDPNYNTAPKIWGTQKGTIILISPHIALNRTPNIDCYCVGAVPKV